MDSNGIADAMAEFLHVRYPKLLNQAANLSAPPHQAPPPPSTPAVTHNLLPGISTSLYIVKMLVWSIYPLT